MKNSEERKEKDSDLAVQEAQPELSFKEPSLYQVVIHNDDFTPMEFVIDVLEKFFNMDTTLATSVMFEVHVKGKAVCGVFTRDVAETKVDHVMEYARVNGHPLLCSMEENF